MRKAASPSPTSGRPGDWTVRAEDLGPKHAMNPEVVSRRRGQHGQRHRRICDVRALTLGGRVILSDGKPIAPESHVSIRGKRTALDESGRFSTTGLLPDSVAVSASVKGYRLSRDNRSLDASGRFLRGSSIPTSPT